MKKNFTKRKLLTQTPLILYLMNTPIWILLPFQDLPIEFEHGYSRMLTSIYFLVVSNGFIYFTYRNHLKKIEAIRNAYLRPNNKQPSSNTRQDLEPIERIDIMDGHEFEYECARILKGNGFEHVEVTQGSGDFGIDVFAEKENTTYAIQCKRFASKVGNKAVQEVFSGKSYYGKTVAAVMTNNYFTPAAIETAREHKVLLWDRSYIEEMLENMSAPPDRLKCSACDSYDIIKEYDNYISNGAKCANVIAKCMDCGRKWYVK